MLRSFFQQIPGRESLKEGGNTDVARQQVSSVHGCKPGKRDDSGNLGENSPSRDGRAVVCGPCRLSIHAEDYVWPVRSHHGRGGLQGGAVRWRLVSEQWTHAASNPAGALRYTEAR